MENEKTAEAQVQPPQAQGWDGADRREIGPVRDNRRKSVLDRRLGLDRRRGPGRRRSDTRRKAEEGEMTDEQFEFITAIDQYKRLNRRPFPSWTEVLDLIHALGYRKVAEPKALE